MTDCSLIHWGDVAAAWIMPSRQKIPITLTRVVSLNRTMTTFTMLGSAIANAWGRMTRLMVRHCPIPSA